MPYGRLSGIVEKLPDEAEKGKIIGEVTKTFFNFEPPISVKGIGDKIIKLEVGSRVTFHVNEKGDAVDIRARIL